MWEGIKEGDVMSDLRGNNAPAKMSFGATGKIIAATVVAVVIAGAAGYSIETGYWTPHHQVVADNGLPSPSQP
jgi:hypothetical protein